MAIANAFTASNKKLEEYMLQKILKEPPPDWEWMSEEQRDDAIARSKAARGHKS
jgi:hypothetical protein